ncbi:MAG: PAS domain S-box protein [Bacteroidales bacterium]|nr:PAS domain S-box protein [Bacteroidales bacterium]
MTERKPSYRALEEELHHARLLHKQLKENEKKIRIIFKIWLDAIGVLKNETYDFVNSAYLKLFGFEKQEELLGTSVLDQIAPSERERTKAYLAKRLHGKSPGLYETIGLKKTGEEFQLKTQIEIYTINKKKYYVIIIHDTNELIKAEQSLKESNEKFSVAFYKSSIAKSITSFPEGVFSDVNKSFEQLSGYSLSEIKNRSSVEIIMWANPSDRERFAYNMTNNIPVKNHEFQFRKKNGEIITCLLSSEIIFISGKKYILSNIIDITDRIKAEEKLRESEMRWQFSVDGSGLGLWDWNTATNKVFFSKQWKNMLGYEEHEIMNTLEEWDKRVHPDDKERVYADINKHIEGITPIYQNEHRVLCKNGQYKWILDRGKVVTWSEDGKPLRIIGTHTDIDVQKRMQEEFIENTAKFRLLFEQSPLGIYIATKEGEIIDGNNQLLELLGSPSLEATKQINVLTFPALVENGYANVFKKCVETGEEQHIELRYTSKWGKALFLSSYIVPLYNKNNELQYIFTLMEDITERKDAELELHKLNATKDKFFSIIAHDLRGPIGSIMHISELMSENSLEDETTIRHFVKSQRELTQNTYYLLENLLNWAKYNRKQIQFNPKLLEVSSIIDQNIANIKFRAKQKRISILTEYTGKFKAYADEDMIKLVVRNLLENAVKFTLPDGFIRVVLKKEKNELKVRIINSGPGISAENIQKILSDSEFYSTQGTENEKGTGLGLKLVRNFIAQNNGNFNIQSEINKETCFSFTLPAIKNMYL